LKQLRSILKEYWGYETWLPLQQEAMASVMANRDSLVVLPTGGGKSLCFQAPALAMPGMALVVSPLISLMKDQVDGLNENGVPAACLNSTLSADERREVRARAKSGSLKLLYVAPERLVTDWFLSFLRTVELSFVAIDEAHCISMWGHDFRPEYHELRRLRDHFPGLAFHGYTATATEQVRNDILSQLRMVEPEVLIGSFDRPNLTYRVARRATGSGRMRQITDVIDRHHGDSGIIYCISRKAVEKLSAELNGRGYQTLPYHAGLTDGKRKANQDAFIKEETDIIVATVAFGMGIDKSNVRFVIHAAMPQSPEHYQQESGRAGRDGLEADCCLFYSLQDYTIWKTLLSEGDEQAIRIAYGKLDRMLQYCSGVTCRHEALLGYFGQHLDKTDCGACDVCEGDLELAPDGQVIGQKILSCVIRLRERFGGDYTAKVLTGSSDQRILQNCHDTLSTYGLLASQTQSTVHDWVEQMVAQGFLRKTGEFNVLTVTTAGWTLIRGDVTPQLLKPAPKSGKQRKRKTADTAADSWDEVSMPLFEEMRALRRSLASERGVPPFVVFSDATLRDMAQRSPQTLDEFLAVHGVGEKKRDEYGEIFLELIAQVNGAATCGQAE
jgi:ATP-dependent DNA helicase RecQ